jgi:hypothetical protein
MLVSANANPSAGASLRSAAASLGLATAVLAIALYLTASM